MVFVLVEVVSVTKKGQATIPKRLRRKYGIKDKVLIEEDEKGIVLKPLPSPDEDFGSLKLIFKGKSSSGLWFALFGRKTQYVFLAYAG